MLQKVYNPAGTSRDFTRTYASHSDPVTEFKQRLIVQTPGLKRDFESPSLPALVLPSRGFKSRARTHRY